MAAELAKIMTDQEADAILRGEDVTLGAMTSDEYRRRLSERYWDAPQWSATTTMPAGLCGSPTPTRARQSRQTHVHRNCAHADERSPDQTAPTPPPAPFKRSDRLITLSVSCQRDVPKSCEIRGSGNAVGGRHNLTIAALCSQRRLAPLFARFF
jgi:hypothetical protein